MDTAGWSAAPVSLSAAEDGGRKTPKKAELDTMESEVLKAILACQGAVNTDYLVFNLGFGDSTNEVISNREKFALSCPYGQPKVVARTKMRLCRAKDCQGACRGLHLCKNFLFSGSCPFTRLR